MIDCRVEAREMLDAAARASARGFQDYAKMRAAGQYLSIRTRDYMVALRVIEAVNDVMTDMENRDFDGDQLLQALAEILVLEGV